jgi:hypothetical protein
LHLGGHNFFIGFPGSQFTCFTDTKVQIVTEKANSDGEGGAGGHQRDVCPGLKLLVYEALSY